MAHPYMHARSSAKKFGGRPEDYQEIHDFFDSTKSAVCNWQHRMILHNSFGIFLAERLFGTTIENSDGRRVPVRLIGEQHVTEDLGWVPSVSHWARNLQHQRWMTRGVQRLKLDD